MLPAEFEGYVAHDDALFPIAYDSHATKASHRPNTTVNVSQKSSAGGQLLGRVGSTF
jgi:hypothetical protein